MGRSERRLFPELYPLHAFANELRKVRARADSPTYAAMARRTGRSSTALSEAAAWRQTADLGHRGLLRHSLR